MTERQNGQRFSALDADHDATPREACAESYRGGWWYGACYWANLNGRYYNGGQYTPSPKVDGVVWYHWKNTFSYSLQKTEMKFRVWVVYNTSEMNMKCKINKTKPLQFVWLLQLLMCYWAGI